MSMMQAATRDAEPPGASSLRKRAIEPGDHAALADLLAEGFPSRGAQAWRLALSRLHTLSQNGGRGMGFVLAAAQTLVGVLLVIHAPDGKRASLSSWYVRPEFRRFATLLVGMAMRDRSMTYLNISSEKNTRPIIEAQGFRRYADGIFFGVPLLGRATPHGMQLVEGTLPESMAAEPAELEIAGTHRDWGCLVVWRCEGRRARPLIFARRRIANRLTAAQVVYCPDDTDWRHGARSIGMALLRHGLALMLIDATAPLPGMPGRFMAGRMPKYVRGPDTPRLGDLAWTEAALFGA